MPSHVFGIENLAVRYCFVLQQPFLIRTPVLPPCKPPKDLAVWSYSGILKQASLPNNAFTMEFHRKTLTWTFVHLVSLTNISFAQRYPLPYEHRRIGAGNNSFDFPVFAELLGRIVHDAIEVVSLSAGVYIIFGTSIEVVATT
jgi:hypothetical protein